MKDNFKTGESLEKYLDSDESKQYRDNNFFTLFEISEDNLTDCPYWIETYYMKNENYQGQYIPGYWESKRYGDILTIDGQEYEYIDSQPLSEEIEHQADDGALIYEYRGYSFLRILKAVNND